jgi:hypothetical protein
MPSDLPFRVSAGNFGTDLAGYALSCLADGLPFRRCRATVRFPGLVLS